MKTTGLTEKLTALANELEMARPEIVVKDTVVYLYVTTYDGQMWRRSNLGPLGLVKSGLRRLSAELRKMTESYA